MATIPERIRALQAELGRRGLDWYLVPSSDEHLNEYLPLWRCRREHLSGFTGSAGDLLVGRNVAWLYTDGRYHLQAEQELAGSGIALMKVGAPGSRRLLAHLKELLKARPGARVGFDPMVVAEGVAELLEQAVQEAGGVAVPVEGNLVDALWPERPAPSTSPLIEIPLAWSGASVSEKLAGIREDLAEAGALALVAVKLDQVAWLLNLRGRDDVPYNPVFESFLVLDPAACHLFLRGAGSRLPPGFAAGIPGLEVHDYAAFPAFLRGIGGRVLLDPAGTTRGVKAAVEAGGAAVVAAPSPIEERKAVKNAAEQEAMRRANLLASVAKTRAWLWLRRERAAGRTVTEVGFRDRLEALYAAQEEFFALSFNTISATGPHGAIIHYGACDATPLEDGHLFLIDSGIHVAGGTTDDTRTYAVGRADARARRLFTLVLKGHINAARQRIPDGCPGTALDALARSPLWNDGLNYDHGTGHGVGAFLNVHEGPFAISERERKSHAVHPLKEGIVSSIEPGCYVPGWGGIRLENLYLFVKDGNGDGRSWLRLEPLTWVPFDPALTEPELLDPAERRWLEDYHQGCAERLAPHLEPAEVAELRAILAS